MTTDDDTAATTTNSMMMMMTGQRSTIRVHPEPIVEQELLMATNK